jgi:hypothetical protein
MLDSAQADKKIEVLETDDGSVRTTAIIVDDKLTSFTVASYGSGWQNKPIKIYNEPGLQCD